MSYSIKEIFYSLQGEGFHSGRPAIFCRFSGCNLSCSFCDTDFIGTNGINGGTYTTASLIKKINLIWPSKKVQPFVVCTGGEPLLQVDKSLITAMRNEEYDIAVETNGTIKVPTGLDWIAVSPKPGTDLQQKHGNELKVLYPVSGLDPNQYDKYDFEHLFIQPVDAGNLKQNVENQRLALQFCQNNPHWRFSLQLHKLLGIQ